MRTALMRGDVAGPEREKAPRRQPESPTHFSTSRPGYSSSPAADQELRPARGKDGSTVIRNVGQLKKTIGNIVELLKLRYGRKGCPLEHSTDVYRVVAAVEAAAAAVDPKFMPDLHAWSDRHLRRLSEAERAAIRADLRAHPVEVTQLWVGEQLGLLDVERDAVKFFDALAVDMTAEAVTAKKKARAAQLARARRERVEGATPRSRCRARLRELQPEVSTSTWYHRNSAQPGP